MKCPGLFLFLNLFSLLSLVSSLEISVSSDKPVAGQATTVTWTKEASDPKDLTFDLRFVQDDYKDVGLAKANIHPDDSEETGQLSIKFPTAGDYQLVAVSGSPGYEHIGASRKIDIEANRPPPTSTSPSTSSSTSAPTTPTSTPAASHVSGASKNARLPAVLGGVIGALLLVTLLIAAFIYVSRRREAARQHRISFHKDMMVQRKSPDSTQGLEGGVIIPFPFSPVIQIPAPTYRPPSRTSSTDSESPISEPLSPGSRTLSGTSGVLPSLGGMKPMGAPLGAGHVVAPPRGPRGPNPSIKSDSNHKSVHFVSSPILQLPALPVAPPLLTSRQKDIVDRIVQLQNQMNDLRNPWSSASSPDSEADLDAQKAQLAWLENTKLSKWALNETDIKPAGYSKYMTS